jgi:[ribosomal protein S5]-alanine N-acetyltransferase
MGCRSLQSASASGAVPPARISCINSEDLTLIETGTPPLTKTAGIMIETDRLMLIAGTLDMVIAEMTDTGELSQMLDIGIPLSWPPELVNERTMNFCFQCLCRGLDQVGWSCWYIVLKSTRMLIGMAEFTGKPGQGRSAEIGYTVLGEFQSQGYGTEAISGLIDWAFCHSEIDKLVAETTPDRRPSIRVLEKCGFTLAGYGPDGNTIRFELPRSIYARTGKGSQAGAEVETSSAG